MWRSSIMLGAAPLRRLLPAVVLLALHAMPAQAGGKTVTWYLDGGRVEQEVAVADGYQELPLPAAMQPGSLRVRPISGGRIERVAVVPAKPDSRSAKELVRLSARREELQDRLKALEVQEEIFKATAKSQASKAPRRTRTNPEPLSTIRQGTEFAISRLEEVYRVRRRAERELKEIEQRQAALRQQENVAGKVARVWLAGKRGRVQVAYLMVGQGWQPVYDIRVGGDTAEVTLMALLPVEEKGSAAAVVPARLAETPQDPPLPLGAGAPARVAGYRLPVVAQKQAPGVMPAVTVTLRNDTGLFLPPGEASGFRQGEFLGKIPFPGLKPGESSVLSFGN